eukprot:12211063-Karenia_brevis.AAC.1
MDCTRRKTQNPCAGMQWQGTKATRDLQYGCGRPDFVIHEDQGVDPDPALGQYSTSTLQSNVRLISTWMSY